ncbi:glycoside hydrolase family 125 protein [Companilactobacillus alimentarius]|uniref:glycoside hydrolase family 125 protein n=1 Tax=Companilactobacillus alimentarius TaxID=1602 RepID=UPI0028B3F66B|nr:glycoside hydrolase family 125 protein [Companilactobacillus alimentarius]MDT6951948.1 glycoside hydrolase family 125 protein [Companilactobacillus alimentarius]
MKETVKGNVLESVITDLNQYSSKYELNNTKNTKLFRSLLTDVLIKATKYEDDGSYFVKTGDIPAMWLRDATFQVLPYVSLINEVPDLYDLLTGVLKRELRFVKMDPYANAFNQTSSGAHWSDDDSNIPVSDHVWERKFEIDSLCAPLFLANNLYEKTGNTNIFDEEFWNTLSIIMDVFKIEQHHNTSPYYFKRKDCPSNDTLPNDGRGTPVTYTGMIWNGFRPSDNACVYGYHIPSNMFVVSVLTPLLDRVPEKFETLKDEMSILLNEIKSGIKRYAIVKLPDNSFGYAYEVDGLGNYKLMDDANVPSLLSLPFIKYCSKDNPLYLNTRKFILSTKNPYYYSGKLLQGIGSNHTPINYVWPISIAMEGLTSDNLNKKAHQLDVISKTNNDTSQCHESIDMDDQSKYTRDWFSWSNMTYCQLALDFINKNVGR